ncbi:MAG: Gfo/Idh/MocA family oxidoreductase [Pirellulaceae bacterium]|jgi:predicted dehydrogenase|nr:Gfo/Idh/MocA family oxidoreductase [Pirellulaceae bacterium]HJN10832.1 Gfo/Idh/MocA family oxidoreductase [Pirellulaceae bacterium]
MPQTDRRQFIQAVATTTVISPLAGRHVAAAETSSRIRIGQIGTKHAHASGKMATMRKFSDDYEVVGVVEPDANQRKRMEATSVYRGLNWMTTEQLLAVEGLQAVAVEAEVRDLLAMAHRCIAAKLHVHLDKPAGENLPEFKRLLDASTRHQRVVQMGYMYRYNPAFQFLFNAVKQGWLGQIFEIDAVMSKTVNANTRKQLARYPGGSMFELGCHLMDAIVYVAGKPDRVTAFNRQTRPDHDNLLDNCLAVLEYPKTTATIRSALIEVDGGRRRQFVVCGDQGTIDIRPLEPPRLTLTLDQPRDGFKKGTQEVELPALGGRYDADFKDLAKIIRGEKSADFSVDHDLAVQAAVLNASGIATT